MSAEAIKQVTNAIKSRLDAALIAASRSVPNSTPTTTYVGPLDDTDAASSGLILFLYRVQPNQSLRNDGHTVTVTAPGPGAPAFQVFANALALDLHYILTVGPRDQAGEPESLRHLGYAMQALNDDPILVGSSVGGETVRITVDTSTTEEMSRVWALFPRANYRTSVLYLVSPVWLDPGVTPPQQSPVLDQGVVSGQRERA